MGEIIQQMTADGKSIQVIIDTTLMVQIFYLMAAL